MDGAVEFLALLVRFGDARVVAVDVAHAELRHFLVALLHLAHRPFERHHRLLRIGDHGRQQMRNAVIDGQFEHFRIDHDQPALVGMQPVDQAQDHRVDGDRFARAGGAGDQQMRHAGEIDQYGFAADRLAEAERQLGLGLGIIARGQKFAEINLFAVRIRQLDADSVASRHHGDACRQRAHRAGDVVGEADHARRLDARRGFELVKRDDRTRPRIDDLAAHAEIAEHAFECGAVLADRLRADRGALAGPRYAQKIERRQGVAVRAAPHRLRRRPRFLRGGDRHFVGILRFVRFVAGGRWRGFSEMRFDPLAR